MTKAKVNCTTWRKSCVTSCVTLANTCWYVVDVENCSDGLKMIRLQPNMIRYIVDEVYSGSIVLTATFRCDPDLASVFVAPAPAVIATAPAVVAPATTVEAIVAVVVAASSAVDAPASALRSTIEKNSKWLRLRRPQLNLYLELRNSRPLKPMRTPAPVIRPRRTPLWINIIAKFVTGRCKGP